MIEKRNSYIISKGFRHYFFASILYALVEQLCTMLDMVFAGNFVASQAFSAMDLVLPFETFVTGVMLLLVGGAGTIASNDIGNQKFDSSNKVLTIALFSSALISLLVTVLSYVFMDSLVGLMCNDPVLSLYTRQYLEVYVLGLVPMSVFFSLSEIIDIDGEPKLVTKAVVAGCIVNVVLDVVLMKYLNTGVAGVAISSIFAYSVPVLIYLPYLFSNKCKFRLRYSRNHKTAILTDIITYGFPCALPYLITFVMAYIINSIVFYNYGSEGVYVWGVGLQILLIGFMVMDSIGRTVLITMGSMLYGCSDIKGLRYLVYRCFKVALFTMLILITLVFIFPKNVFSFFGEESLSSLESSKWSVRYIIIFLIPYACCCIKAYLMQILGQKKRSMLMFVGLIALTLSGIVFSALGDSTDIFLSIPFTSCMFLILDGMLSVAARLKNPSLSPYFLIPQGKPENSLFISIPFTEDGMNSSLVQLDGYLETCVLSPALRMDINICCEELIYEIVRYGNDKGKNEEYYFDLFVLEREDRILVKIQDAGCPFNPVRKFDKTPAEAYLDGEEMNLSLQIINRICEKLEYNYLYGQNTIYMTFRKRSDKNC